MTDTKDDTEINFRMGALLSDLRSRMDAPRMLPEELNEYLGEIKELVEAGLKQAREDTYTHVRKALWVKGMTDSRDEFLRYCLIGAIENDGYGPWMLITAYDDGGMGTEAFRPASARIIEFDPDETVPSTSWVKKIMDRPATKAGSEPDDKSIEPWYEVTHDTIERGLFLIRHAVDIEDQGTGNWEQALTSVYGLHRGQRDRIIAADMGNEASDLDVVDYLAILEIALFNEIRYC